MKMKSAAASLTMIILCAGAAARNPADAAKPSSQAAAQSTPQAMIEGVVSKDPGSEPVKKAIVELISLSAPGSNYTAVTGPDGSFTIGNIVPGQYRMFVERTGYLESDRHHARSEGRILTLAAGQELKDLVIRLQAAAVIHGRVTDEDGDPLFNADVAVFHETFASGHRRWEQAGGERTNDLGEYRVAGLAAGNYYVSVSPPPDFKSLIATSAASTADSNAAAAGQPAPTSYQTTYYPGTTDRGQAAPVQLRAGDEFPVNFSLTPSPSLTIRGSVVDLPPRSTAVIMLQSRDFNLVLNGADIRKDGSFVIRDVSPGSYTIVATVDGSAVPMSARQSLQVTGNVEGLRLAPQTGASIRGRLLVESKGAASRFDPSQIFLVLHPTDADDDAGNLIIGDQFTNLAHVLADGSFEWKDVPAGNYYVQIAGESESNSDWFVKSALTGGREVNDSGFSVNGGAINLDLVLSTTGAVTDGVVTDAKGQPVSNAIVVAVPDLRFRSRIDRYRKTISDQSGHFTLHGVPPGDYTLFAWESVDGDAFYGPEFLKGYEGQGIALRMSEGDRKSVPLQVIPDSAEQP
jgi:hypothetical protein